MEEQELEFRFQGIVQVAGQLGVPHKWLRDQVKACLVPHLVVGSQIVLNCEQVGQHLLRQAEANCVSTSRQNNGQENNGHTEDFTDFVRKLLTPREVDVMFRLPRGKTLRMLREGALPFCTLPNGEFRLEADKLRQLIRQSAPANGTPIKPVPSTDQSRP